MILLLPPYYHSVVSKLLTRPLAAKQAIFLFIISLINTQETRSRRLPDCSLLNVKQAYALFGAVSVVCVLSNYKHLQV